MRRRSALPVAAALVVANLAFAPTATDEAGDRRRAPAIGETDLFNLELVGNHDFRQDNGQQVDQLQGTDLEFFTASVVVRDADGDRVGPDGGKLPDDAPDHVAERDFAVVGDRADGMGIFDVTDPENFFLASYQPCAQPRNDVGIGQFVDEDGLTHTVVALSRDSGRMCDEAASAGQVSGGETGSGGGFAMFDLTDPFKPTPVAAVSVGTGGSHNLAFHPTELILYAWNGQLPGAISSIQIVDLRPWAASGDLEDIVPVIGPETLGSVHDGEFSPDGSLMYVASENNYEIFDNSDPLEPVRLGAYVPNIGTYAHGYFPTPDGSISITNNESLALGGFFADNTMVCPGEGITFYDTSDPANVIGPLSTFVPPVQGSVLPTSGADPRACTSHFGRVAPNGQVITIGWYILGARVVDFSNPSMPVEVAAATIARGDDELGEDRGTEAWAAKTWKGPYLYVGDQERGFDVFRWTPDCAAPWEDGWDLGCLDGTERLPIDPAATAQATTDTAPDATGDVTRDPFRALGFDPAARNRWSCRLDPRPAVPTLR